MSFALRPRGIPGLFTPVSRRVFSKFRFTFFGGWGYVHLFQSSGGKMAELDTYAIPEAHDPAYASGFGDLLEAMSARRDRGE